MHFTRWYIKSPSGNFYELYRGAYGPQLFLTQDANDCDKALRMNLVANPAKFDIYGNCTFNGALEKIYEIEASGTYPKVLSDAIENSRECKAMYSCDKKSYAYQSW